jgi:hypothetical protein
MACAPKLSSASTAFWLNASSASVARRRYLLRHSVMTMVDAT